MESGQLLNQFQLLHGSVFQSELKIQTTTKPKRNTEFWV